jgi:acetyl-CoA acyltransferase
MQDAFICDYIRTPIGRYGGALAGVRPDDLAAAAIAGLMARAPQLDRAALDEVYLGCANQAGEDGRNVARMALLLAGLPETVPGATVNRLCGSGLEAVAMAGRAIALGEVDLIVAGGVESMSRAPFVLPKAPAAFARDLALHDTTLGRRLANPLFDARFGTDSLAETAENVAEQWRISRADQDAFAQRSQQRAAAAQASGRLAREIVAVPVPTRRDPGAEVAADEHPRPETTLAGLAALKAPFRAGGTVTAGNASGVNDGAAALLVASAAAVRAHGLVPLARISGAATAGVAPRLMGMGPVPAVARLCARLGLAAADFDVIELNEAFAAQALAVLRQLGLADDAPHVNPNGGAIALGHPLGMSGARLAGTAALELSLRGGRRALATMCIGVGQGIALALEAV